MLTQARPLACAGPGSVSVGGHVAQKRRAGQKGRIEIAPAVCWNVTLVAGTLCGHVYCHYRYRACVIAESCQDLGMEPAAVLLGVAARCVPLYHGLRECVGPGALVMSSRRMSRLSSL